MKRIRTRLLPLLLAAALLCVSAPVPVLGATINATLSANQMALDEQGPTSDTLTCTYSYTGTPPGGSIRVNWTSSNPNVAAIASSTSGSGGTSGTATATISATAPGTATITMTVVSGGLTLATDRCEVTVAGLVLNTVSPLEMTQGDTRSVNAVFYYPAAKSSGSLGAGGNTISWSALSAAAFDGAIPAQQDNGSTHALSLSVPAKETGSAADHEETLTLTVQYGSKTYTRECTLRVKPPVAVTGVALSWTELALTTGGSAALTATIEPANAKNQTLTWVSSDDGVADFYGSGSTVTVYGVGVGTATITVTTGDGGFTDICTVTVTPAVTGVTLDQTSLALETGLSDPVLLIATVEPDNAADRSVTWTSSDPSVAAVDANGRVTPVYTRANDDGKPETATAVITARTNSGGLTAACTVTVTAPPLTVENVELPETLMLDVGKFSVLAPVITAPNAADQTLTWTSSDPSVAAVAADGTVTGVRPGTATITAKANAGGKTGTCAVTVSGATLNVSALSLIIGEGQTLSIDAGRTYGNAKSVVNWRAEAADNGIVSVAAGGETVWTVTGEAPGSTTVTITGSANGSIYTLSCRVTVSVSTLAYSLNRRGVLDFSTDGVAADVSEYCSRITGSAANYVMNLAVDPEEGTLYYNYAAEPDTGAGVAGLERYYFNASGGSRQLARVTFVPKTGFTGTATISYGAYGKNGNNYRGQILVNVGQSDAAAAALTYDALEGTPAQFSAADISDYCQSVNGRSARYVTFTLPSATAGTLQYNRINEIDGDLYESPVAANTRFYRTGNPNLDDVWFVPQSGYSGTVSIPFSGVDTAGNAFSGTIRVNVTAADGTTPEAPEAIELSYSVAAGSRLYFGADDFNALCRKVNGQELNYIKLGSTGSTYYGTLYYGNSTSASTSYAYYASASGSRRVIGSLNYAASANRAGSFSIPFTATDVRGGSFSGTIRVTVTSAAGATIYYTVSPGEELFFNVSDFSATSYSATSRELNYVQFTRLPASGQGRIFDSYGAVSSLNVSYYRVSSYTRRLISDLSFVASEDFTSGSVTIPFTGWNTNGRSFTGSIVITAVAAAAPEDPNGNAALSYSTTGPAVSFRREDFVAAAAEQLDYALSTVRFTSPSATAGRLCVNYLSPTSYSVVDAADEWAASALSTISFQPRSGYRGTVYIPYAAKDITGKAYSGYVKVTVTPPTVSSYFSDMGGASWAVPAVDFFRYYGILNGTNLQTRTFGPGGLTKRGDYILMLSRAFSYPSAGTVSFLDVPASSYYAAAIAGAKRAGVISGDSAGNFSPEAPITRQDAAVMLYRSMARAGSVPSGSYEDLAGFSDRDRIASYAVTAMAVMVRLGVFVGDGSGRLNPTATLSRAEMALIFYRAIT